MIAAVVRMKSGVTTRRNGKAELNKAEECSHTRLACLTQLCSVTMLLLPRINTTSRKPGPGRLVQ
jgi:hypothetical protein